MSPRKTLAKSFAEDLKRHLGADVVRVLLYGSVARGDDGVASDIDLVIVVRERRAVDRVLSSLLGRWAVKTGEVFQPLVVTREEMDEVAATRSEFANALREEGEILA